MAAQTAHGIRLSALCPKFLHTNSTSHTWPFSAIAELIDNAYDPDVNAKQIWIDKTVMNFQVCLTFTDNGNGMTPDKLHKMLSFGFSDKVAINGHVPVGLYGNGFKSGSMRLGKDAIVFTKNESGMHVGMLSQSYLEAIHAEHVIVPIISFNKQKRLENTEDSEANLKAILTHSLLSSEKELLAELDAILGKKGTRIIIWNLRRDKNKFLEFDFDKDKYDIRIPDEIDGTLKRGYKKMERADQVAPDSDYSLRAYCSILYLKPRMQIILRGQKVQTQLVCKSLAHIEKDVYRPKFLAPKTVTITFGYNCRNKEHYGIMMYHKNRLIKAYVRVGCQLKANYMGVGVVGVIQCNFLKPTHNKQDFDYTNDYRLTLTALGEKLNDYWNEMTMKKNLDSTSVPVEDTQKSPDQTWVQCDSCLKWRKLPDAMGKLPVKWYCYMNADPQFRDCNVPEEPEDDDALTHSTYEKTYKRRKTEQLLQQINEKATIIFTPPNKDLQPALNSCSRLLNKLSSFPATSSEIVSESFYPDYRNKRLLARDSPPISAKKPKAETIELTDEIDEIEDGDVIILEDSSTPKPRSESEACENDLHAGPFHEDRTEDRPPIESSVSDVSAVATQTEGVRLTVKKEEDVSETEFPEDHQPYAHCNGSGAHREPENLCNPPSPACANHHERESYRKYSGSLEQKVKDLQNQLVEMKNNSVKKEVCHKSTQTGDCLFGKSENAPKQLVAQYEQALKEIDRLKLQCSALLRSKSEPSAGPHGDGNGRADDLARQLGVCSTERDQYKLKVEKLSEERAQLTLQNNQLKTEVQQLKLMVQDMNKNNPAWTSSLGEESLKLRILRMNVAGLLTTLMPELDLQQSDYGFDTVDDILVQVLEQTEKQANGHE